MTFPVEILFGRRFADVDIFAEGFPFAFADVVDDFVFQVYCNASMYTH